MAMIEDSEKINIVVDKYKSSKSGPVAAILEYFGKRERNPRNQESRVWNLRHDLHQQGMDFSVKHIQDALKFFGEAGFGRYIRGRPLENSRIKWNCSPRELAHDVIEAAMESDETGLLNNGTFQIEEHRFPVRPGVTLPIKIRSDMSKSELENMANFIRVIAASRGSDDEA